MEEFFVDGGKKLGRHSEFLVDSELGWKKYLDGGDDDLVERMIEEEEKERNTRMEVGS